MLADVFSCPGVVSRFQQGPLGPYLDALAAALIQQGYAGSTIQISIRSAASFGRWLARRGIGVEDVDEATVAHYLGGLKRYRSGNREKAGQGLSHIVRLLRQRGVAATRTPNAPPTQLDAWLIRYDDYLHSVAGLRVGTRQNYVRFARYFMTARFSNDEVAWSVLTAQDLGDFVRRQAASRKGFGRKAPGTAIRSLLRFLVFIGAIESGFEGAIPTVRQWTHAALPRRLSAAQIERILGTAKRSEAPNAARDYAIVLLLSRLGMRAHEVVGLRLDDIDWAESRLLIHPGKTHQERALPLSQEVGAALAEYLQHWRPRSRSRVVFLKGYPPFDTFARPASIGEVARAALRRADIELHSRMGAHTFRHTVASEMVCQGAAFKDVADVLGHRSLQTTGIYAKLDLDSLQHVALPWMGGAP